MALLEQKVDKNKARSILIEKMKQGSLAPERVAELTALIDVVDDDGETAGAWVARVVAEQERRDTEADEQGARFHRLAYQKRRRAVVRALLLWGVLPLLVGQGYLLYTTTQALQIAASNVDLQNTYFSIIYARQDALAAKMRALSGVDATAVDEAARALREADTPRQRLLASKQLNGVLAVEFGALPMPEGDTEAVRYLALARELDSVQERWVEHKAFKANLAERNWLYVREHCWLAEVVLALGVVSVPELSGA